MLFLKQQINPAFDTTKKVSQNFNSLALALSKLLIIGCLWIDIPTMCLTTILSISNQTQKVAALCMEEQTLLEWSSEKNVEKLLPSVRLRAEAIHIPDIEVVLLLFFFPYYVVPDLCIPRKSRLGRIYIPISKKFCKWRKFAPFLG